MPEMPTEEDGRKSLKDHIVSRALEAREVYGPHLDMPRFRELLEDRRFVRYPVELQFEAQGLQPGEFAIAIQRGDHPREGFTLKIHPMFQDESKLVPLLAAYHLITVNYGEIATNEDAELLGATLTGMDPEAYYAVLCQASDRCGGAPNDETSSCHGEIEDTVRSKTR